MIPGSFGIRLDVQSGLRFRPGETVTMTAIRRLSGDRWEVSVRGKVLVAHTSTPLTPGQSFRARVGQDGSRILLHRLGIREHPAPLPAVSVDAPEAGLSERIVSALLKSGIAPDPARVERIRRLLAGRDDGGGRLIRLITLLLDKNLDPTSPGFSRVLALLHDDRGGQGREGRPGRRGRERREEPARAVTRLLKKGMAGGAEAAEAGDFSPLALLNHLRAGHQNWLFIPYRLAGGGAVLSGVLRLLYDPHLKEVRRLVVECRPEEGPHWAFVLTRAGGSFSLNGFSNDPEALNRGWESLPVLRTKLQNIGVEVDDIIREYREFDGFSLPEEGPRVRAVDTWQ